MIIKGGARCARACDVGYLDWHLLRRDTNASVLVRETFGTVATDLRGALVDLAAFGAGAATKRPLYHGIVCPNPADPPLTDEQKDIAVCRLGEALGLSGQARVVVEHQKDKRVHLHVVWSRVDLERMATIHDGWNYLLHEQTARALEAEFGHTPVQGALTGRETQQRRPDRTPSAADMAQAERTGLSSRHVTENVVQEWEHAQTGAQFAAALAAEGAVLARGDRRDYVIVGPDGEVHSLARRLPGVRTADIKRRMADVDPKSLPSVQQARASQAEQRRRADVPANVKFGAFLKSTDLPFQQLPIGARWHMETEIMDHAPWEHLPEMVASSEQQPSSGRLPQPQPRAALSVPWPLTGPAPVVRPHDEPGSSAEPAPARQGRSPAAVEQEAERTAVRAPQASPAGHVWPTPLGAGPRPAKQEFGVGPAAVGRSRPPAAEARKTDHEAGLALAKAYAKEDIAIKLGVGPITVGRSRPPAAEAHKTDHEAALALAKAYANENRTVKLGVGPERRSPRERGRGKGGYER